MRLRELISEKKDEIVRRWIEHVRGRLAPTSLPERDIVDHLGVYIDEIVKALRKAEGEPIEATLPGQSPIAEEHGHQRFKLGFDVPSLVREYGLVQDCILDLAQEAKLQLSIPEARLLVDCLSASAAESVEHYVNARDEESRKQAAKHFAFIAHELRNPLQSAILAFTSLRLRGMVTPGKASDVVGRSHQRLRDLIDHSLVEVRLQGGLELRPEPFSVMTLLEDARAESIAEAEDKNITVKLEARPDLKVEADPRLLRSAITNLLRNAIKFSHEYGTVTVRANEGAERVVFEVEDECGGLPPEKLEKIFDPFVQIGPDRSGFGLGLAISKQVTEAHHGSLRVTNLPKKGCVFMLDIPHRPPGSLRQPGE
jgi:signal transduction histidine kinase